MSDIYLQITETPTVVTLSAPVISGALSSTVTVANVVTVALDSNSLSALENVTVTVGAAITGTVTVSNFPASQAVTFSAVTISNFPASQVISGTVTANPTGTQTIAGTVTVSNTVPISGTVTANIDSGSVITAFNDFGGNYSQAIPVAIDQTGFGNVPISGTVTVGNSVTISSLPALAAGTANIGVVTIGNIRRAGDGALTQLTTEVGSGALQTVIGAGTSQIGSVTASISNSVTIASLPAISGTVTANSSNGSLTTRFGSVTTANTAFATSAVTNANRKYLLIQNVTTASNVITVGIGFTPTTTQGIQLSSGAGLTFEGNYIPTGAVNLLSSVTASCFTILEA